MATLKHHVVAAMEAVVLLPRCAHQLVEVLSVDGRTLDNAIRHCADCYTVIGDLTDAQVEAIRDRVERLVRKGHEEQIEILVECESALAKIARSSTTKAARARVAALLAKAYERKAVR